VLYILHLYLECAFQTQLRLQRNALASLDIPSLRSEMRASEPQKEKGREDREEDIGELVFGVTEFPWGNESEARKSSS
jgi:hypothetical protein